MRNLRILVVPLCCFMSLDKVDNIISAILARQIMLGYPDSIAFKLQY